MMHVPCCLVHCCWPAAVAVSVISAGRTANRIELAAPGTWPRLCLASWSCILQIVTESVVPRI